MHPAGGLGSQCCVLPRHERRYSNEAFAERMDAVAPARSSLHSSRALRSSIERNRCQWKARLHFGERAARKETENSMDNNHNDYDDVNDGEDDDDDADVDFTCHNFFSSVETNVLATTTTNSRTTKMTLPNTSTSATTATVTTKTSKTE